MRKDVSYNRPVAVDPGNAIDWEHPDNRGLVYLMGGYAGTQAAGGIVSNLVRNYPLNLVNAGSSRWVPTIGGASGISCQASGALSDAAYPTALNIPLPITVAISLASNGTSPAANSTFFGVSYTNTDSNPYVAFSIGNDGTTNVQAAYSNMGGISTIASSTNITTLRRPSRVVFVYTTARVELYINGISVASSTSTRTGPSYTANSRLCVGGFSYLSRNANCNFWGGRIQNFAADANWVLRDCQRHLDPTADDRLRWFSTRSYSLPGGSSDAIGTATGTSTASGVGSSAAASVGSSAGVGASSVVGSCTVASAGSSAGVATASATGSATTAGVGSSAGTGAAAAVGASTAASVGASAGVATVSGVGSSASSGSGVGSSSGVATVSGVGASVAASAGASAGIATAAGVGSSVSSGAAVGSSAGVATAAAVGASAVAAIFSAIGTATAQAYAVGGTSSTSNDTIEFARTVPDALNFTFAISDQIDF